MLNADSGETRFHRRATEKWQQIHFTNRNAAGMSSVRCPLLERSGRLFAAQSPSVLRNRWQEVTSLRTDTVQERNRTHSSGSGTMRTRVPSALR